MDFNFTEDHESLRDAVRRYIDKSYTFQLRQQIVKTGGFDRKAYATLAGLGLTGLRISEAYGGMGLGSVESMIVMEELGRGLALEPMSQNMLCSQLLHAFASEILKQTWLPKVASGEALIVLALQERGARYQWRKCEAKALKGPAGFTLSGTKNIVSVGDHADAFLVPAQLDGNLALFLVQRDTAGISVRGYGCQDGSRAADVMMQNAPAELLTLDGEAVIKLAIDLGIAHTCSYAVGVMDKTLALTAEYLNTRKQFGVPLSSFQSLRHRIADMKMQLELARSMSYFVNLKLTSPSFERSRAASQAKVQLSHSMRFIGQQGVQLHGGIGITDEYIMSHYLKVLTQQDINFGDDFHHLAQLSYQLQDTAGVFS
ncbi:acyl-CoA dehydrogenase family protein [Limnohabitans sp. Hippo4]|uniref:acyl-CoA dehydrogenase family protein n=1 Tax=Limnohabitans sp. Hippo4 TaxID=1826167 RepID=UPI000D374146|nr:acyl-CoA dehydrogenase family protein [Limnohabitans sp. Hippo4]PUE36779.1 acyl-CoA dehydrogenase [Limnohabitans sp. Hippo4]